MVMGCPPVPYTVALDAPLVPDIVAMVTERMYPAHHLSLFLWLLTAPQPQVPGIVATVTP